ncbi:MAG: PTS sugar transporter subunit IIB [Firmicutes bacterium]|nr:PTS sugar transporter subunit IIB [Bacillota bacterium]
MKRFKIVTVCGCGLGSSLIAKMAIDEIVNNAGYTASIETADGGSAKGHKCDFFVTTKEFAPRLEGVGVPVVVVTNFVNKAELKEKLLAVMDELSNKAE